MTPITLHQLIADLIWAARLSNQDKQNIARAHDYERRQYIAMENGSVMPTTFRVMR